MKNLRELYGMLIMERGIEYANKAIQTILSVEVRNRRMTLAESKRIFASLGK